VSLPRLLSEISACRICEAALPQGPRPVLRVTKGARLLIVSQAPGIKAHQTGVPWNGLPQGDETLIARLNHSIFYDERIAFVPIGFCYPGTQANGADKPPRPECAPHWHERVLNHLSNIQLTLLVGQYSQKRYLGSGRKQSMTETVKAFSEFGPNFFPLPHPSWRSRLWMRRQPWFERVVIPKLRTAVHRAIAGSSRHDEHLRKVPSNCLDCRPQA